MKLRNWSIWLALLLSLALTACGDEGPTGEQGPQGPQGSAGTVRAWAWVQADGSIVTNGGESTISVIKVGVGQYCLQTNPDILNNYSAVIATLNGPDLDAGFINANTGWGSVCNPHGGYGVFTANASGVASDKAFSVIIP